MSVILFMSICVAVIAATGGSPHVKRSIDCHRHHCLNGGHCVEDSPSHGHCRCIHGYTGETCQHSPCHSGVCHNGGTCHTHHSDPYFSCDCQPGYTGLHCANGTPTNTNLSTTASTSTATSSFNCKKHHCHQGGHCIEDDEHHGHCACVNGFIGESCQYGPCYNNPCRHGGVCNNHHSEPYHTCTCLVGYNGTNCETHICDYSPCQNGGECHHRHHHSPFYACVCHHGYSGQHCEHGPPTTKVPTTATHTTHSFAAEITSTKTATITSHSSTAMITSTSTVPSRTPSSTAAVTSTPTATIPTTPDLLPVTTKANSQITTSASVSTSTTAPDTPTTPVLNKFDYYNCSKLSAVSDIANKVTAFNQNTTICSRSGLRNSPTAFVLNHCDVAPVSSWRQGKSVMTSCHTFPLYTPVATFELGEYVPEGSQCGVFLGCIDNGFLIGMQYCDHPPTIEHIVIGGIYAKDPNNYYSIQSYSGI